MSATAAVLTTLSFGHWHVVVTPWKLVGWAGALCFTLRWLVQAVHRHRTGSGAVPVSFWWISLVGAAMTCSYFIFGKNDSVGIIQNLFPMAVSAHNLWLDLRQRGTPPAGPGPASR